MVIYNESKESSIPKNTYFYGMLGCPISRAFCEKWSTRHWADLLAWFLQQRGPNPHQRRPAGHMKAHEA
jgi:hypothetical protein